jgi:hypothetical protein
MSLAFTLPSGAACRGHWTEGKVHVCGGCASIKRDRASTETIVYFHVTCSSDDAGTANDCVTVYTTSIQHPKHDAGTANDCVTVYTTAIQHPKHDGGTANDCVTVYTTAIQHPKHDAGTANDCIGIIWPKQDTVTENDM